MVEADAGAMAGPGSQTHEFQVLAETGEDELVYSDSYGANIETAVTTKTLRVAERKCNEGLAMIKTPNANTCEDVAKFLSLDIQHTLKSLIYKSVIGDEEEFIFVALLGDDKINEIKLKNYIKVLIIL